MHVPLVYSYLLPGNGQIHSIKIRVRCKICQRHCQWLRKSLSNTSERLQKHSQQDHYIHVMFTDSNWEPSLCKCQRKELWRSRYRYSYIHLLKKLPCPTIQEPLPQPLPHWAPELGPRPFTTASSQSWSYTRFPHQLHPRFPIVESQMSRSLK